MPAIPIVRDMDDEILDRMMREVWAMDDFESVQRELKVRDENRKAAEVWR